MPKETYTPAEIVQLLEQPQMGYAMAHTIAVFWPTIKLAIAEYGERHPEGVKPRHIPLD